MRIVCPDCSATYEVKDTLVAPGRAVRCTQCNRQWVVIPADSPARPASAVPDEPRAQPQPQPAPPPRLTAMDRLASQPAAVPRTSYGLRAAWAASFVLLLMLGCGVVIWRTDLMRVWPPSARLYDAIGLGTPTPATH